MKQARLLAALMAVALVLVGCETPDPDGEGANVVDQTDDPTDASDDEPEMAPEPDPDEPILGTRENPVPPGTTFVVGDWEVTVGETVDDATDQVMGENEFNEIAEGRQPVMISVSAKYIGEDSGNTFDLSWAYLGSAGNTFGGSDADDFCGVIPDAFDEAGEAFPEATVEGNVCFQVPSDQVEGGAWIVEDTFSFDGGDRTFVAAS